jgi:hypothetical protein
MNPAPSDHVRKQLERIRLSPLPRSRFNAATAERMLESGWATSESLPSPYPSHVRAKAGKVVHLRITPAGLAALKGEALMKTADPGAVQGAHDQTDPS